MGASEFMDYCEASGFSQLPISGRYVRALETIERPAGAVPHNDPFDRTMLAQAKADGLLLLTHDVRVGHSWEIASSSHVVKRPHARSAVSVPYGKGGARQRAGFWRYWLRPWRLAVSWKAPSPIRSSMACLLRQSS